MDDDDSKLPSPPSVTADARATLITWQQEYNQLDQLMGPVEGSSSAGHVAGTTPPSFSHSAGMDCSSFESMPDLPPVGGDIPFNSVDTLHVPSLGEEDNAHDSLHLQSTSRYGSIDPTSVDTLNRSSPLDPAINPPNVTASAASLESEANGRDSWSQLFERLKRYKEETGDSDVPQKVKPLGTWVNKQRMEKKRLDNNEGGSMTRERQLLLESIGFKWAEQKGQVAWDKRFNELVEFKREVDMTISLFVGSF